MGQSVFPVPQPTDLTVMTPNVYNYQVTPTYALGSASAPSVTDLFTITGKGIITELKALMADYTITGKGFVLVIDGVEYPLFAVNGSTAYGFWEVTEYQQTNSANSLYYGMSIGAVFRFKTSAILRVKNYSSAVGATTIARLTYYT